MNKQIAKYHQEEHEHLCDYDRIDLLQEVRGVLWLALISINMVLFDILF